MGGTPTESGRKPISFLLLLDNTNHFLTPSPKFEFRTSGNESSRVLKCTSWAPDPNEGMDAGEKGKNKNYSWYSAQGPSRMAQTPQAGTGNSVSQFVCSRCSTLFNYHSNFPWVDTFAFNYYSRPRTAKYS